MQKYDIQVTLTVLAKDEKDAEQTVQDYLKESTHWVNSPNFVDWEFTEFVPSELKQSCCC